MEMVVGKIVGVFGEGEWGQVHNFGDLVVAVSFAGGAEAGREALTRIRELQHGEGLEKAVKLVEEEFGAEVGGVMMQGGKIYVVGNTKFWVKRGDGRAGWLSGSKILVSNVEDGLTIIAGNGKFWNCVSEGMVRAMTEADDLATVVHGREEGRGAVGAIIKFQDTNPPSTTLRQASFDKLRTSRDFAGQAITKHEKIAWWKEIRLPKIGYQMPRTPKVKPIWAGVGFLVVAILVVGGGAVWKKEMERKQSGIDEKIETIKQKFDEAKGLATLNPVRSRELLDEIENGINGLRGIKGTKDLVEIEKEIERVREEAMGVKRPAAEEVIDLGLVRDGMTGLKMAMGEGGLWVVGSGGRVVEVNLKQMSGKVIAQVGEGKTAVLGSQGVVQIPTDREWGEVKDMGMWAGNIYLLDTDQIWVYRTPEKKEKWLGPGDHQPLAGAESMAIDGNIWVLGDRKILKFTRGVKEIEMEIERGDVIYTDDNAEKLYVLDKDGGRIIVIKKTGEDSGQYILEQAKEATDIIVDEQNHKLYLLSGAKIYKIEL